MSFSPTVILGTLFLVLGVTTTYTMFQYWGYPYDKEKRKSTCPQWKMNIHRALGLAYVLVYIVMMVQMVPRIWHYQIEFPARTVAHMILGTTIGFILIIKLSILRWFRHFEEWMPVLGTLMLFCTVLLTTLSVPFFFKEAALASGAYGDDVFSKANHTRIKHLLPEAGFSNDSDLNWIASEDGLKAGRRILLDKCVYCHDLKTAIDRPRTPNNWVRTVKRMIDKPTLGVPISLEEGDAVTAYLIGITPDLQQSAKEKRIDKVEEEETQLALSELSEETGTEETRPQEKLIEAEIREVLEAVEEVPKVVDKKTPIKKNTKKKNEQSMEQPPIKSVVVEDIDSEVAKSAFDEECSLCHGIDEIDAAPPKNKKDIDNILRRMVDNGFEADRKIIRLIRFHMAKKYLK